MSDLLSSVSIILGILALIYSNWYQDIQRVKNFSTQKNSSYEWAQFLKDKQATLRNKLFPLISFSIIFFLNFAPTTLYIISEIPQYWKVYRFNAVKYFDPIKSSLVLLSMSFLLFIIELYKIYKPTRAKLIAEQISFISDEKEGTQKEDEKIAESLGISIRKFKRLLNEPISSKY